MDKVKILRIKKCGDCPFMDFKESTGVFRCTKLRCEMCEDTVVLGILEDCPLENLEDLYEMS